MPLQFKSPAPRTQFSSSSRSDRSLFPVGLRDDSAVVDGSDRLQRNTWTCPTHSQCVLVCELTVGFYLKQISSTCFSAATDQIYIREKKEQTI